MFGDYDITWCSYAACPLTNCKRHLDRLVKLKGKNTDTHERISIADFAGTCRDYLSYALAEIEKEKKDATNR
jgi:hypothetical protein